MLSVSNIQSNKLNYEAQLLMLVFITVKPNRLATILVVLPQKIRFVQFGQESCPAGE